MKLTNILFVLFLSLSSVYTTADEINNVVGMLKTNEHLIIIANGPDGPIYTVKNSEGTVVLEDKLSKVELVSKFPNLGELVNIGIADDASLSPHHLIQDKIGIY